jgi:hypothetical protein
MPKRPRSAVLLQRDWCAAITFCAALSAVACATAESPEFAPPVNDGGTAGAGATGGSSAATGGSSGAGVAGAGVAGSTTTGGSAGAGATGGSAGKGGSAGTATGGGAGKGGSAGSTGGSTGGSAGSAAGSGGSSGATTSGGTSGSSAGGSGNTAGTSNAGSSGGPPTGALFFDDFEDGSASDWISADDEGTPITGWSIVADGSSVFKQGSASSDPSWSIGGDVSWTDQIVEVKIKFDDVPDESAAALVAARFTSFDSYYYLEIRGDGGIKIRKRVDGSTGDVTRYDPDVPLTGNTWYTVGIGAVGTTLTAYFGGVPVAMGTDSDLARGGIGIGTAEEAVVAFDDVSVTAP